MAVREFRDDRGRRWKAWDIKPEKIRPVTRGEDYLVDCYITGWIVFETASCDEKRRLCPWPMNWTEQSEAGLRRLLARAEPVSPLKLRAERQKVGKALSAQEVSDAAEAGEKPDVTDLEVVRSFRYPGGRIWTVCVINHPEDGGSPVLRFSAGQRYIDVKAWPREWPDEPNDRLAELLRKAAPRPAAVITDPNVPRRRWNDQVQPSA